MAVAKYRAILRSHLEKSYQQLCGGRKAAYVLALAYAATFVIAVVQHLVLDELGEVNGSTGSAPDTSCRCKGSLLTHHGNRSQPTRSFCGPTADRRGSGQRVLSFSLYGPRDKRFIDGIEANVKAMKKHYPKGYTIRVYHDKSWREEDREQMEDLCRVFCDNRDVVDLCSVRSLMSPVSGQPLLPKFGMMWRFAPMVDPLVDEWHSRDLDSRPSEREWAAVDDWLRSGSTFHVMRDHTHHWVTILGGMFGMRMENAMREGMIKLYDQMLTATAYSWTKGLDQFLLDWYLWPVARENMVCHDSYWCETFTSPYNRAWPTRRLMQGDTIYRNFVGSTWRKDKLDKKCPEQCRPKNHMDWEYC